MIYSDGKPRGEKRIQKPKALKRAPDNPWGLNETEKKILLTLTGDLTMAEAARVIGMEDATARTHLLRARKKMGLKTVHAAVLALDRMKR